MGLSQIAIDISAKELVNCYKLSVALLIVNLLPFPDAENGKAPDYSLNSCSNHCNQMQQVQSLFSRGAHPHADC